MITMYWVRDEEATRAEKGMREAGARFYGMPAVKAEELERVMFDLPETFSIETAAEAAWRQANNPGCTWENVGEKNKESWRQVVKAALPHVQLARPDQSEAKQSRKEVTGVTDEVYATYIQAFNDCDKPEAEDARRDGIAAVLSKYAFVREVPAKIAPATEKEILAHDRTVKDGYPRIALDNFISGRNNPPAEAKDPVKEALEATLAICEDGDTGAPFGNVVKAMQLARVALDALSAEGKKS